MTENPEDAAQSAAEAAASADVAASAAETALFAARVAKLEAETAELALDEAADSAQTTVLGNLIGSVQSQMLWITSAAVLVGAAADHILTSAFS